MFNVPLPIVNKFSPEQSIVVFPGDCLDLLRSCADETLQLVVTSPPYNIGKEYEKKLKIENYLSQQAAVIRECVRCLSPQGSICWQVGNYVDDGAIIPLDTILYPIFTDLGLRMRNRIIWHFEHGLHCSKRLSGRYETIMWFTKTNDYVFNLDPIRVPQKYPGKKYFKGPKAGEYSGNPLGKNPGDLWIIPNVKSNHVEKTEHPCQFPVELIERLVLSLTNEGDWVFDPFLGTGASIVAAVRHGRKGAGAETIPKYVSLARQRIEAELAGTLRTRPMHKPVYDPVEAGNSLTVAPWTSQRETAQMALLETPNEGYTAPYFPHHFPPLTLPPLEGVYCP
jgi:adenine-specific DNA-methyltransferase